MAALRALNLLMAAMMAGGLTIVMVAVVPTFHRLPDRLAVTLHREVDRYVDVPLPIFTLLTFVTCVALLFDRSQPRAVTLLTVAGAGGAILVALGSHLVNRPMNMRLKRWENGEIPAEYPHLRWAWDRAHAARTVAGVLALLCLIGALLVASHPQPSAAHRAHVAWVEVRRS